MFHLISPPQSYEINTVVIPIFQRRKLHREVKQQVQEHSVYSLSIQQLASTICSLTHSLSVLKFLYSDEPRPSINECPKAQKRGGGTHMKKERKDPVINDPCAWPQQSSNRFQANTYKIKPLVDNCCCWAPGETSGCQFIYWSVSQQSKFIFPCSQRTAPFSISNLSFSPLLSSSFFLFTKIKNTGQ